jgi:hypothetical protein
VAPATGQILHRPNARATISGKLFAPYAVWLDLAAPDADGGDARAAAQLPDLISGAAGWEVTAPTLDTKDDNPDESEDDPPDLLDVRVLAHPSGAFVGLAIDTEVVEVAVAIGTGLALHVTNAAPALAGMDPRLDPQRDPHQPMRRFTYECLFCSVAGRSTSLSFPTDSRSARFSIYPTAIRTKRPG